MSESPKELMIRYLQTLREAALWKLDGVSEYDARRPLVQSGSNLLGIVKHLGYCEFGYFTRTFGRELPVPDLWAREGVDPHDDLWVPADESRQDVIDFYRLAQAEAARTFAENELDSVGRVPWWPEERARVTLHQILVHMSVETARHVGQMDVLREGLDGAIGVRRGATNLPDDDYDWKGYLAKVQAAAEHFR
ncbi:MAG: DinB family protein [Nocardioides sp.]